MSAGIAAWSVDLLRTAGFARWLGAGGLLVGLAPAAALILGQLHLEVQGMLLVVVVQAIWSIGVGVLLLLA